MCQNISDVNYISNLNELLSNKEMTLVVVVNALKIVVKCKMLEEDYKKLVI